MGVIALRALLNSPDMTKAPAGLVIEGNGERPTVSIGPMGRVVSSGASGKRSRALLRGPTPEILALAAGRIPLELTQSIIVEDDRRFAEAALSGASRPVAP